MLTDYEALPRVFHNIETSRVRQAPGADALQLVQTCKWAFLVFRCGLWLAVPPALLGCCCALSAAAHALACSLLQRPCRTLP